VGGCEQRGSGYHPHVVLNQQVLPWWLLPDNQELVGGLVGGQVHTSKSYLAGLCWEAGAGRNLLGR
jgi:hypothetical protein